jgi:hypothetical protein
MLLARPFPWAASTDFDARLTDQNKIAIHTKVTNQEDLAAYEALTKWMIQNVYPGSAETLTSEEASMEWDRLSKFVFSHTIDDATK